jgi:hypothetical protein
MSRAIGAARATGDRPLGKRKGVSEVVRDVTPWDEETYLRLISSELTEEQRQRVATPALVLPRQKNVLAVHWHPEFVPTDLIEARIEGTFPNRELELIIPTQHNQLLSRGEFSGVEVDCYSRGFNRKVQLLIHFHNSRLDRADRFRVMLAHTFRYRSHQLFEFISTILEPAYEDRLQEAAAKTGAEEDLVEFTRVHARKILKLYEQYEAQTPPEAIRNKLLTHYFEALRDEYDDHLVSHACMFLRAIKAVVKAHFSPEFFYATEEIIEEVRGIGGGIVIPHPEQFWPILLADYDVDGIEVWNPQSREYTEFLISVVGQQNRQNRAAPQSPLLIFMGDDTHMGEKVKPPRFQDSEKAKRELGVQPAWDDLAIRKTLILAETGRQRVIEDYRARLIG